MTSLEIVLGVVAAGLAAIGCVLLLLLLRARAEAAGAVAARERTEGELSGMDARIEAAASEATQREGTARARADESGKRVLELSQDRAQLQERLENAEAVRQELDRYREGMKETFKALSGDALKSSNEEFLKLARQTFETTSKVSQAEMDKRREAVEKMVEPIAKTLGETRERLDRLDQRLIDSKSASEGVREEAARLVKALSRPEVRGQYGEIQLKRVAELAGMREWCDYSEQTSVRDDEGRLLRPDMVVRMPAGRVIAVDAKTNTYAYLEAVNASDEAEREMHLERFTRHVVDQVKKLGSKAYWASFDESVDFVVMFVPGDHLIDAALSRKPELIEIAWAQNVILASPSTLIGLLRAVAVGWRESRLADEARELFELGKELHERAATVFEHAASLGKAVNATVERFNKLTGSLESRLTPTLRKFEDAGAKSAKELVEVKPVERSARLLESGGGGD